MRRSTLYLSLAVLLLGGAVALLWQRNGYLKEERNRYRGNTEALLSEMKRIRVDSVRCGCGWTNTNGCGRKMPSG